VEEVRRALKNAAKGKAAGDSTSPIEYYQALAEDEGTFGLIMDVVLRSWRGENITKWTISKLKIYRRATYQIPTTGARSCSLRSSRRSQVACSLSGSERFLSTEHLGLPEQFGFQKGMGTTDGSFVLRQAINLRSKAGKDTHVLFVDLVEAFDSVPRDGLLRVLAKYGVPETMLSWIGRIYSEVIVKVDIEGATESFAACTGVKQGDNLSPTLFLFMMQAFMELIRNKEVTGRSVAGPAYLSHPPRRRDARQKAKHGRRTIREHARPVGQRDRDQGRRYLPWRARV